jgi:bifunctional polynucleotide phosphatase/kinase
MIIFVGAPASGKSTWFKRELEPKFFARINRDTLGSMERCRQLCEMHLSAKRSVVIDNTNPASKDRQMFVELAEKFGTIAVKHTHTQCELLLYVSPLLHAGVQSIKCFIFNTPTELARHLNVVRERETNGAVPRVPEDAYARFHELYEEPTKQEGFSKVYRIPFVARFDSEKQRRAFLENY